MSPSATTFISDVEIERIGKGLIARDLPSADWSHAAHWAAAVWLIVRRPDLHPPRDMPGLICAYNLFLGGFNTDTSGYHETITQASLRAARFHVLRATSDATLAHTLNTLLSSELGQSDWLMRYWSKARLFSLEARKAWIDPDLLDLPYPPYPV